jgi:hypothetical protein
LGHVIDVSGNILIVIINDNGKNITSGEVILMMILIE